MRKRMNWTVLGLLLGLSAVAMADIPFFWLDKPAGRTNKNDPNSPLYVQPLPTMPAGSATFTPTITPSQTMVVFSPTHTPTYTATPTQMGPTATFTRTPAPSCTTSYNFESGVEGWFAGTYDCGVTGLAQDMAMPHCGTGNLALTLDLRTNACGGGGSQRQGDIGIGLGGGLDYSCKILSAWIYVPAGMSDNMNPSGVVLFAKTTGSYNWRPSAWNNLPDTGGWTEVTFDLSTVVDASDTREIGVQILLGGSSPDWAGTVYVDQVTVSDKPACVPAQSPTNSPTYTHTPTLTATPSASPSASPTASPSPTSTPAPAWPTVYNGDVVALGTNVYMALESPCTGCGGGVVETTGTGAHGSGTFAHVTLAATGFAGAAVFNTGFDGTGPTPQDASSGSGLQSLEISLRIPAAGNCYPPAVKLALADNAGTFQWNTKPVLFQPYIIEDAGAASGPVFLEADKWYTARIPISAFLGDNGETGPANHVVVDADLAYTHGVAVQPAQGTYDTAGAFNGEIDVDDVRFVATASSANSTGFTHLISDFEKGDGSSNYGTYWFVYLDSETCATRPSAINFPGPAVPGPFAPPVGTGGALTSCHAGHFDAIMGDANGCPGYSAMGVGINFKDPIAPIDVTSNVDIAGLPATGATGLRVRLKLGPNSDLTAYVIKLKTNYAPADADLYWQLNTADGTVGLNTSTYVTINMPFPADGAPTTAHTGAWNPGSDVTEAWWGSPGWATSPNFSRNGLTAIEIGPSDHARTNGFHQIDIYFDDVEFTY